MAWFSLRGKKHLRVQVAYCSEPFAETRFKDRGKMYCPLRLGYDRSFTTDARAVRQRVVTASVMMGRMIRRLEARQKTAPEPNATRTHRRMQRRHY